MKNLVKLYNGSIHNNENKRPALGIACYKCTKEYKYNETAVYELINIKTNKGLYDSYILRNTKTGKISSAKRIAEIITVSISDYNEPLKCAIDKGNGKIDFDELRKQLEQVKYKTIHDGLKMYDEVKDGNYTVIPELTKYMVSNDMTEKMENIPALSTSCKLNPNCALNKRIHGSICEKCYAENVRYSAAVKNAFNTLVLCTIVLPFEALPKMNYSIFRFEAFSDLFNEIHAQNFINIALKNPRIHFGLWTKRPQLLHKTIWKYYHGIKPKNISVVVSSLFINETADIKGKYLLSDNTDMVNHVFTVYTAAYALEHNINIQCGNKKCWNCEKCYLTDTEFYINEIVKDEQKAYYSALGIDYKGRQ